MKIAVMTNPYDLMNELQIINQLFAEGLEELHLRKPVMNKNEISDFISAIPSQYHSRIILHSHYSLVKRFTLKGIHVDDEFVTNNFLRWALKMCVLGAVDIKKYVTVHSIAQLPGVTSADEVMLGPVFRQVSQYTCNRMMTREKIIKAVETHGGNLSGLGSVCMTTISEFLAFGFKSVTVQSAIWKCGDPVASYRMLRDYVNQAQLKTAA